MGRSLFGPAAVLGGSQGEPVLEQLLLGGGVGHKGTQLLPSILLMEQKIVKFD